MTRILFTGITTMLLWSVFSIDAAGLPELLQQGMSWEYATYRTIGDGFSSYSKQYWKVQVTTRTERNDTVFITTSETLTDTSGAPGDSNIDTIYSIHDTTWQQKYAVATTVNGQDTGYTIIQLDTNYLITGEGKTIHQGFLPGIFPSVNFSNSAEFPIKLGDASYSMFGIGEAINTIYHSTIGLIYNSMYFSAAGGSSQSWILSYCDSVINVVTVYGQIDSLKTRVTHPKTAPNVITPSLLAAYRYDFLGRKVAVDTKRFRSAVSTIESIDGRARVNVRPMVAR